MNHSLTLSALVAVLSLAACDRPAVVAAPVSPPAVAGPAGPQGATGNQGEAGKSGDTATVIVLQPAASAPSN